MAIPSHILIKGAITDEQTRCKHYHSARDIIAIKMKCCNTYYPCIDCHNETETHPAEVWQQHEFNTRAVLCGNCYTELTIKEYLDCNNQCPECNAAFNPGCSRHYHLYFKMKDD